MTSVSITTTHFSSWNPPKSDILYTDVRICRSAELSSWNPPNLETYNTNLNTYTPSPFSDILFNASTPSPNASVYHHPSLSQSQSCHSWSPSQSSRHITINKTQVKMFVCLSKSTNRCYSEIFEEISKDPTFVFFFF
jgi:hypothetical protein